MIAPLSDWTGSPSSIPSRAGAETVRIGSSSAGGLPTSFLREILRRVEDRASLCRLRRRWERLDRQHHGGRPSLDGGPSFSPSRAPAGRSSNGRSASQDRSALDSAPVGSRTVLKAPGALGARVQSSARAVSLWSGGGRWPGGVTQSRGCQITATSSTDDGPFAVVAAARPSPSVGPQHSPPPLARAPVSRTLERRGGG